MRISKHLLICGSVVFLFALSLRMDAQMPKTWEAPLPSGPKNDAQYTPGPDSERQPGVPEGKVFTFKLNSTKIFPGSTRTITVYVPAHYTGETPACVYVGLDGLSYKAPIVFDNLIHKGEIPLLIGIGLAPGSVPSTDADANGDPNPRYNRSSEFDALNDKLCRFLIEEIFPAVESHTAPNGAPLRLSRDPNNRCTGGGSTGGIAAFTLAWERPDQFRRVFSSIGTFVGMRGGDRYPVLVRKTEPKPIRIFVQDGSNDQWLGGPEVGDWWTGNLALQRSLEFSGYDIRHDWGTGSHNPAHATAIFSDAIRWLWRDWPAPVSAMPNKNLNVFLNQILKPEENWSVVAAASAIHTPSDLAVDQSGAIHCRDVSTGKIMRLAADGTAHAVIAQPGAGGPLAFGPDGKLYAADNAARTISACDPSAKTPSWKIIARDVSASRFVVRHNGDIHYTDAHAGTIGLIRNGTTTILARDLKSPAGLAPTPDNLWFAVIESSGHFGKNYRLQDADGTLDYPQNIYWFHVPDTADNLGSGACAFDRDGRLYVATRLGVAALDRNGRTRLILPMPAPDGIVEATDVCFGGENFGTLFVISGNTIYKRKLKITGAPAWLAPIKLPRWGQG